MTPATDDDALGAAFEAYLAGRGASLPDGGLAAFADGVRATAARPPRPSAALAGLLATGLLTDQSSASARTTPAAARTAPRADRRGWRRRTAMLVPTALAKFASLGVAAKAATVAGVAVVGLSTAGFTDALPSPAQHAFATVVDTATPLTAPDPTVAKPAGTEVPEAPESPEPGDATATTTPAPTTTGAAGAATTTTQPGPPTTGQGIGGQVSQGRHDGTLVGSASSLAHQRNDDRRAAASSTGTPTDPADGTDGSTDGASTSSTTTPSTTTGGTEDGHGRNAGQRHGDG